MKAHLFLVMEHTPCWLLAMQAPVSLWQMAANALTDRGGCAAIQSALFCSGPDTKVHIFGMNWSPEAWEGHRVSYTHSATPLPSQ